MLGEVNWLSPGGPASRACGFQEFRALSEGLLMDDEQLLIGLLAGEYFEGLFEVEPSSQLASVVLVVCGRCL